MRGLLRWRPWTRPGHRRRARSGPQEQQWREQSGRSAAREFASRSGGPDGPRTIPSFRTGSRARQDRPPDALTLPGSRQIWRGLNKVAVAHRLRADRRWRRGTVGAVRATGLVSGYRGFWTCQVDVLLDDPLFPSSGRAGPRKDWHHQARSGRHLGDGERRRSAFQPCPAFVSWEGGRAVLVSDRSCGLLDDDPADQATLPAVLPVRPRGPRYVAGPGRRWRRPRGLAPAARAAGAQTGPGVSPSSRARLPIDPGCTRPSKASPDIEIQTRAPTGRLLRDRHVRFAVLPGPDVDGRAGEVEAVGHGTAETLQGFRHVPRGGPGLFGNGCQRPRSNRARGGVADPRWLHLVPRDHGASDRGGRPALRPDDRPRGTCADTPLQQNHERLIATGWAVDSAQVRATMPIGVRATPAHEDTFRLRAPPGPRRRQT